MKKLRDTSFLLPMERLYFTNGIALPDAYKEYGAKVSEKKNQDYTLMLILGSRNN